MFSKTVKDSGYAAGLWKSDLIRGLLWYVEDAKLLPSKPANDTLPSWSWASAGDQLINHALSNHDNYIAISRIEDVHVDLVDPLEPFGSVTGGRIIITGPFKKLSRLCDERWKLPEASLSELERHLSKLVAKQSVKHVESKHMAPPVGRLAVIQVASCCDGLHLLLLEAVHVSNNSIDVYRRVGIFTLQHAHKSDEAEPKFIKMMEESSNSLAARLGPPQMSLAWQELGSKVYEELEKQPWDKETVLLV